MPIPCSSSSLAKPTVAGLRKAWPPSIHPHYFQKTLFYYGSLARDLAAIDHPGLMIGIPLYSDIDWEHDHVVQAAGAFDQTLIGLQNLGRYGVPVEIRVVIHRHTYKRLPELAEFIYRNLTFAAQVVFMGLETMGFAVPNLSDLWIDPVDYSGELVAATTFLANRGISVSIYNHQLCVVPKEIWSFCKRSISDWTTYQSVRSAWSGKIVEGSSARPYGAAIAPRFGPSWGNERPHEVITHLHEK